MRLRNLRYVPGQLLGKEAWLIGGMGLIGGGLLGLVFWIFLFPLLEIGVDELFIPLVGAIVTVALIIASIIVYLTHVFAKKHSLMPLVHAVSLIVFSAVITTFVLFHDPVISWALSYFVVGILLSLYEIGSVSQRESLEATVVERATYRSREKKVPYLNDPSSIGQDVFEGNIDVCKGDTILAVCEDIEVGRALARKLIATGKYGICITGDRPFSVVEGECCDFNEKLYCIDCFTNSYGLSEFRNSGKRSNCYTLDPITIRQLHRALRNFRKQIISQIKCTKSWQELDDEEKGAVEAELSSAQAVDERKANVRIVYDSVSALALVFGFATLLEFLIHDTNVDKTIGRNTLLLVQEGALDHSAVSQLESLCRISLSLRGNKDQLAILVKKPTLGVGSGCFSIPA